MDIATLGLQVDGTGAIRTMDRFRESTDRASRSGAAAEKMAVSLKRALVSLGLAFGVREVIQYADSWKLVEGRIRLVTDSTAELRAVQQELFRIAQQTRTEYGAVATLYARTARNADQLGRSQADLLRFTELTQKAIQLSGASAQEASAGVIQLSQALASGALRGDEFRSVSEQMPEILNVLSESLGKTRGEIRQMAFDGKLTADLIVSKMLEMGDSIDERFKDVPVTVGQAFTVMRNEIQKFIGQADRANGITADFASLIVTLARHLNTVVAVIAAAGTAWVAYNVAVRAAATWNAILTGAETIRAFIALARTIRSAADAMALFSLLGKGAVGVVVAIAAATVGFVAYKKILDDITAQSAEFDANLDKIAKGAGVTADGVKDLTDETDRQRQANEDLIREAKQEVALAGLRGDAQERLAIEFDAVNKAIEAQRTVSKELLPETLAAIEAEKNLRLEAQAIRSAMDEQAEAVEQNKQVLENFAESVQRTFADAFSNILSGGVDTFKELFDTIKGLFARLLSEMLAAEAMKRFGGQLAGALAGVFGGAQLAHAQIHVPQGATLPGFTPGLGTSGPVPVQLEGVTATASKSLAGEIAGALAIAGAAYSVGSAVGGLTTNPVVGALGGAAAGAATGAAIGSVIPGIGTGIGAAIGGFVGLIGGLHSSKKAAKQAEEAERQLAAARKQTEEDIQVRLLRAQGQDDEADMRALEIRQERELAQAREDGILTTELARKYAVLFAYETQQLAEEQKKAAEEEKKRAEAEKRQREAERVQFQGNMVVRSLRVQGMSAEADELQFLLGQEAEMQAALEKWAETNPELIEQLEELQKAEREYRQEQKRLAEEAFRADLEYRRLVVMGQNEAAEALRLQIQQEKEIRDARNAGLGEGTIRQLEFVQFLERESVRAEKQKEDMIAAIRKAADETIAAIDQQTEVARDSLSAAQDQASNLERSVEVTGRTADSLRQFVDSLALNDQLSTLSPTQRFAEAQRQFRELLERAQGGDVEAAGQLQGSASTLLEAARGMFASGPGFVAVFDEVREALSGVADQFAGQKSVEQQTLDALNKQIELLEQQIASLEAARKKAEEDAQKQIEEVQQTNVLLNNLISGVEEDTASALESAGPIIEKLDELIDSTSGWAQMQISQIKDSLEDNMSAVEASGAAYIEALKEGMSIQETLLRKSIYEAEQSRLDANEHTADLIAQLIEAGNLTKEETATLIENRNAVLAAHDNEIDAIKSGADQATIDTYRQIESLEQQRFDSNANFSDQISKLRDIEGVDQGTIDKLEQARQEADQQYRDQIQKLKDQVDATNETTEAVSQSAALTASIEALTEAMLAVLEAIKGDTSNFPPTIEVRPPNIYVEPPDVHFDPHINVDPHIEVVVNGGAGSGSGGGSTGIPPFPRFAGGGLFDGGIRLVGETGPELELTGASRIVSNRDLADIVASGSRRARERDNSADLLEESRQNNRTLKALLNLQQAANLELIAKIDKTNEELDEVRHEVRKGRAA